MKSEDNDATSVGFVDYGLPLIRHFQRTNPEDNNGDFRKRCKRVRLENGAEFLLTSAFVY